MGYFVFIPKKSGGYTSHRFDTEKEAKHFASLFANSYIKMMY